MSGRFNISEVVTMDDWEALYTCVISRRMGRGMGTALRAASAVERPSNTFFSGFSIAVGIIAICGVFVFIEDKTAYPTVAVVALLGVILIISGRRSFRQRNVSSTSFILSQSGAKDTAMAFSFEDDVFFVLADGVSQSFRYHALTDVWEDQSRFCLYGSGSGKIYYVLRKDSFTQGDPEQFRDFIAQKTGKEVEFVK